MSSHDRPGGGHRLFDDEENALATCEAALQWLQRYRDAHGGVFPERIFNALIRLRPSCSPEVIVHKLVDGEAFFWLTLRAVDEADPFNGMWHYTGSVDRCGDYLIGGIRRVLQRELGGGKLESCRHVASIYPVRSRRSDILSLLFLCTIAGEPSSAEEGRWFSAPGGDESGRRFERDATASSPRTSSACRSVCARSACRMTALASNPRPRERG